MQAVEAPVLKLAIAGGIVLALAAFARPHHPHHRATHTTHRLTLHAQTDPNAYYITPFASGDVTVSRDDELLAPIELRTTTHYVDGCDWMGIDTLIPVDSHTYAYSYDETIMACDEGAIPAYKTPRTGTVIVDE